MEEYFTKYIIKLGIFDKNIGNRILSLYKKSKSSKLLTNLSDFNRTMTDILINIYEDFNEIQKAYLCFNLPSKFIIMMKEQLYSKLKIIITKKIIIT